MKKFEFSLERIRSYKEVCLEREKGILAKLNANLLRIEGRINATHQNIGNLTQELNEKTAKGSTIPQIKSYHFQIENMSNLLKDLNREKRRVEDEVEVQLQAVLRASGELKGFDKLKEKRKQEYAQNVAKTEQDIISEFISTKVAADLQQENR